MRNFLIALAVFIIVIVGLGTIVSRIADRKPASKPAQGQTTKQEKFADKATKVRLTSDGAVVGLERHQAIRITVDQSNRTFEILRGYNGEVVSSESIPNDSAAFTRFLIALDSYGYNKENPKASKDERGACVLGIRYIYEATYKSGDPLRSWSSSCSAGRLQGNAGSIQQLFRNQIPEYSKLTSNVNLTQP